MPNGARTGDSESPTPANGAAPASIPPSSGPVPAPSAHNGDFPRPAESIPGKPVPLACSAGCGVSLNCSTFTESEGKQPASFPLPRRAQKKETARGAGERSASRSGSLSRSAILIRTIFLPNDTTGSTGLPSCVRSAVQRYTVFNGTARASAASWTVHIGAGPAGRPRRRSVARSVFVLVVARAIFSGAKKEAGRRHTPDLPAVDHSRFVALDRTPAVPLAPAPDPLPQSCAAPPAARKFSLKS